MPLIEKSSYRNPFWLQGGHLQTIFPSLMRRVKPPAFKRLRIDTPDGDFLDLDHSFAGNGKAIKGAVILSHGMEGHSRRQYILGMSKIFLSEGWDTVAWNFRFCSGEPNRTKNLYHSGETRDLKTVISYCLDQGYSRLVLIGFSMGGNQIFKYLGEENMMLPSIVKGAIGFSVPCDLSSCSLELAKPGNAIYMKYFLFTLRDKIRTKHKMFPELFDISDLNHVKTFNDFDNRFTAPLYGFFSAQDYWEKSSCLQFLDQIKVPALLVNAKNDPFLGTGCYPEALAASSPYFYFEAPKAGGHVGFTSCTGSEFYWSEQRALEFVRTYIAS